MDLIPRLFDPQEGEILIDGVPIRDLPLADLRREIGYVPQESFLFSDTIGSNLAYGTTDAGRGPVGGGDRAARRNDRRFSRRVRHDARRTRDQSVRRTEAAGGAGARAGAAGHASCCSTTRSRRSTRTPRRRSCAPSATTLAGRTALIASHRVSAIRDATWIIVLDEGRIVEQGTHDDLLAAGGRYWALLNRQQLEEAIEVGRRLT